MKISGIDFPKSLLNAQRNNQLVVFCGAGVSIPQPAGLPTFRQLAKAVALGSGETLGKDEPEDRFLGRLAHKGQQVHLQAAEVIRKNAPKPSCLHHDLTALYRNPDSLRIVTTNFDTLFEEAVKERFGTEQKVFRAPALPLGRDFNGIVHVHGSIDSPNDMILTDADFGRAYLSEGWARIFLLDLFRTFTVLFVGYAHNDMVMNYLARALPVDQTRPRFVLTDEADGSRWGILGIKPVFFVKPDKYDYTGLYEGVAGLSEYATRGILDWQSAITRIATAPPSLDQEEMDLVEDGLSDPVHTRFFVEAASNIEWVRWLDENGHLESLFGTGSRPILEEPARILGRWLADTFAKDHSDELFRLIARHGMNLHQEFWVTLGHVVGSQKNTLWEAETLSRWVSLLLTTAPPQPDSYFLLWLGERCMEADLTDRLLDVFREMSAVKTSVKQRLTISQDDPGPSTTAEVVQIHKHYTLDELWEKGLKPNLNEVAEPLLDQLVDSFTSRHRTLCAWQTAERDWDPDSYGRSAIEPHEQDAYPQSMDVLIDAARDSLEHLLTTQPQIAAAWCDQLIRSDVPILRRLAVHALTLRGDLTPNAKIDWVMDKISIHDRPVHHELFRVMRAIYPDATPEQRQAIIDEVSKFDLPECDGEDTAEVIAYQHFTWFTWLRDSDPNCGLVQKRVEDILEQYPNFKPRTWADLNHYSSSGSVEHRSPWNVDQLLSKPAKEWAEKLVTLPDPAWFTEGPGDRVGLAQEVEKATTQDFEWGIELADTLAQSKSWDNDLWRPLMKAWARQEGTDQQGEVLKRLLQSELHRSHARTVAETLEALVKDQKIDYASGLLSQANQVATTLWDNLEGKEPETRIRDWYSTAINHSAGILTQFWLLSISSWYNQQDPRPPKISEEYSGFLQKIVGDKSAAGRVGRSVIARELAFVLAVDQEWAVEYLVPLFESDSEDDRQAVWEGFLYGRISPLMAETLENTFFRAMSEIEELFEPETSPRESFVRALTTLVAYFVDEPLDLWIPTFFGKARVEDRCKFTWNICNILRHLEDDRQRDLWDRWLHKYWENRLQGTPTPLDPPEAGEMLCWLPCLHSLFPEAVNLAIQMPAVELELGSIMHSLSSAETWEHYPEATAKLLIYLADKNLPAWQWYGARELIENLIKGHLPEHLEEKLKEVSAKLGL